MRGGFKRVLYRPMPDFQTISSVSSGKKANFANEDDFRQTRRRILHKVEERVRLSPANDDNDVWRKSDRLNSLFFCRIEH